ncbi:MAG: ATP-binding protein [Alphaproteobacteria bacterium]|nr:ATP-binding protein [Alphaproteobacteria bacterium]
MMMSDEGDTEGGFAPARETRVVIANQLSEIADVTDALDIFARTHSLPETITWRVHLALEELLRNVIAHAYPDSAEHEIEVTIKRDDVDLIATIVDDGIPFNPLNANPPDLSEALDDREVGGLGIHLARSVVDTISYEWQAGKNVMIVQSKLRRNDDVR